MARVKGAKKLKKNQQPEIPLEGKGVERVHIKELEEAVDAYVDARDARQAKTEKEVATKTELLELMHDNREKLTPDGKGGVFYNYGDRRISLVPESESIKVTKIPEQNLEVSDE